MRFFVTRLFIAILWCTIFGAAAAQSPLAFGTFHARAVVGGIDYSENLVALDGERIEITGFMAPPLKPRIDWFMLTRLPMLTCPFCSDAADWPPDVVLVILEDGRRMDAQGHNETLRVVGRLEIGLAQSVEAGLSLIRVYADTVERVR